MTFIERLDELCSEQNISKRTLEKNAGLSCGSTSKWKEKLPGQTSLIKLSRYFNVSIDYLTGESDSRTKNDNLNEVQNALCEHFDKKYNCQRLSNESKKYGCVINVLGSVAAGIPIEAIEEIIDTEEISQELAITGNFFGLRIKGDSMSPRIAEGDTVIVRQQEDAESGDIVIVLINGDSATCKKLMKYAEGISLISFNPAYEPMTFTNEDIANKPVKIIGKVVENRQKY